MTNSSYQLDVFFTVPLRALPDRVRTFAGTLTVTPTSTTMTWFEDEVEHQHTFAAGTRDDRIFEWVYEKLAA